MKKVKTIVMIDDDIEDQEIFLQVIQEIDPAILCLQPLGAKLVLDLLIEDTHRPDFIFVDINMPLMNGFEFLVEVKKLEHISDIPVIVLSTSTSPENSEKAKRLGAVGFMTKPSNFKLFRSKLQTIFGEHQLSTC